MKKTLVLIPIIVVFALICVFGTTIGALYASADAQGEVVIKATAFYPIPDEEFTTTLYVEEDSTVAALDLSFSYNADYVTLVSTEDIQATVTNYDEATHAIRIAYANTHNTTARVDLVSLTFKVNKNLAAGAYPDWLVWIGQDEDEAYTINTRSAYDALPIRIAIDELFVRQKGDAYNNNNDGKINALDALHCLRHSVGDIVMSDIDIYYANVYTDNENGVPVINARDAVKILKYSVKMDVELDNRVNVSFYDIDAYGNYYLVATKSVVKGEGLGSIPAILAHDGYEDGVWSTSATGLQQPDFDCIDDDLSVFARYTYTGRNEDGFKVYYKVLRALDEGFFQAGKYIVNDFQLPNKNAYGSFNMLTSPDFEKVDIIWNSDSKQLAQGISIRDNYTVYVPNIDYTTWVTFSANIYIDGVKYGTVDYMREIRGTIDLPDDSALKSIVDNVEYILRSDAFVEQGEAYRLPGNISLATGRMQYGVEMVQDIDIKWSATDVTQNIDEYVPQTANNDCASFDTKKYGFIFLNEEKVIDLTAQFIIDGSVFKTYHIENVVIPAQPIKKQIAYAEKQLSYYVPKIISGEILVPAYVDRYNHRIAWSTTSETGKFTFGNETIVGDVHYFPIGVGPTAGYMEEGKLDAHIDALNCTISFYVELAGESTIIEKGSQKMPDQNLYDALLAIFGVDDGMGGTMLTEESLADVSKIQAKNYTVDLSDKGIVNLVGIQFVKAAKCLDLSYNDLSIVDGTLSNLRAMHNLEQIKLSHCNLNDSNMSNVIFDKMYKIAGIDLSYNHLTNLSFFNYKNEYKHQMLSLTDLFLQGNMLTDISNLVIDADGNPFMDRYGKPLANIADYYTINNQGEVVNDANGEPIIDINKLLAKGQALAPNVLRLDLRRDDDVDLPSLDVTPIAFMGNLSILRLANCKLTKKSVKVLEELEYLTELDLRNNEIHNDASGLYADDSSELTSLYWLVSLQRLWLDNNGLRDISDLKNLKQLSFLSLADNAITSMSSIGSLKKLTYLDLDNNQLSSANLGRLKNLVAFYAENNSITQVTQYPSALLELRLNGNQLNKDSIENIGELEDLVYLSLSDSDVGDLGFLANLTNLTHLELANSHLNQVYYEEEQQLQEDENGQKTQVTVTVERDNLARLYNLSNLQVLDISDNAQINSISSLTDKKGGLTALKVFYLDNVHLIDASAIGKMVDLVYLSMQSSGVESLNFARYLELLEYANLSGHFVKSKSIFTLFQQEQLDFNLFADQSELKYLFVDSANPNAVAANFDNLSNLVNLKYLSVRNLKVETVNTLPIIKDLEYLDISNTQLNDVIGDNAYFKGWDKYRNLQWLDVGSNPGIFTNNNLNHLYNSFAERTTTVWLYPDRSIVGFNATREAETIHSFLTDIPQTTVTDRRQIHTFFNGSDYEGYGDFALQSVLQGYTIEWALTDAHFVVNHNVLSVSDWNLQTDLDLTLSFAINVYDNDDKDGVKNVLYDSVYIAASPYVVSKYTKEGTLDSTQTKYFNVPIDGLVEGTRDNWTFDGWYTELYGNGENATGYIHQVIDQQGEVDNLSVYGKWLFTVTYDSNGGEWVDNTFAGMYTFVENQIVEFPEAYKQDFFPGGWMIDGVRVIPGYYTSNVGNVSAIIEWTGDPCQINIFDGDNSLGSVISSYDEEFALSEISTNKNGYVFEGWYFDSTYETAASSSIWLNSHVLTKVGDTWMLDLYGKWQIQTIAYNANGGIGTMADSYSTDATLRTNAFTRKGYNFAGWSKQYNSALATINDGASSDDVIGDNVAYTTLYAVWENQANYTLSSDGTYYKVTGVNSCPDGNLYILSTYNGKPVKEVVTHAFKDCTTLKSVVVENGITTIGEEAFSGCVNMESISVPFVGTSATATGKDSLFGAIFDKSEKGAGYNRAYTQDIKISDLHTWEYWLPDKLKTVAITSGTTLPYGALIRCTYVETVTLPDTLKTVSYDAFWGCSGLKNVYIPEGVTSIGEKAFENCSALTEIVVPSTVTLIENKAFAGCSSLKTITLPFAGRSLSATNDYEKVFGYIFGYTKGSESTSSNDVNKKNVSYYTSRSEKIDNKTVYYYTPYTYNIPSSLKAVIFNGNGAMGIDGISNRSAFRYCTTIEQIVIGGNVESIPSYAFSHCIGLKTVVFGESVTIINNNAFEYCSSLTSISLGKNVSSIGEATFGSCSSLTNVQLNQGLQSIGKDAFGITPALDMIVIPSSVTTFGATAFGDGEAFNWNQHLTIYCEPNAAGTNWDSTWNKDKSGSLTANKTVATNYCVTVDWSTVQYGKVFKGWIAVNYNGSVITPSASTDWTKVRLVATYEEQ